MSEEKIFRSYFQRIQILSSVTGPVEKQGIITGAGGGGRAKLFTSWYFGSKETRRGQGKIKAPKEMSFVA